jgi:hypothetical protein
MLIRVLRYFILVAALAPLVLASADPKAPSSAPVTEIRVQLFGQPCFLTGPLDEVTLRAIHAVSPEKLYPVQSADQARQVLERFKKAQLPAAFDMYKDKMIRYLQSQIALFEALQAAKKTGKINPIIEATTPFISNPKHAKEYEAAVKKLEPQAKTSGWSADSVDQLTEVFNEALEQQPDEEYHRCIKKLNVQYTCAFGENE